MTSTFALPGGPSSNLAAYDLSMSASNQLNPPDDSDESSDEWVAGGSPGLLQRAQNAIDTAAEQSGSRQSGSRVSSSNAEEWSTTPSVVMHLDSSGSGYRWSAPTATSEGPSDHPLTTAEVAALDGLQLQGLAFKVNQRTIQIDGEVVLRVDSRGWVIAEVPVEAVPQGVDLDWTEVGGRIVGMVLVSTIFGVAGGALGAFAVGEPVVREAAKVAVGSLVTGVGVATADEIWSRLRRAPEPPDASSLTLR